METSALLYFTLWGRILNLTSRSRLCGAPTGKCCQFSLRLLKPLICFLWWYKLLFPGQPDPRSFIRSSLRNYSSHLRSDSQKEGSWTEISKVIIPLVLFLFLLRNCEDHMNRGPQPQLVSGLLGTGPQSRNWGESKREWSYISCIYSHSPSLPLLPELTAQGSHPDSALWWAI